MMQPGVLAGGDVIAFSTRVLVNGTERPIISWSTNRELNGDLPAQVIAVDGISQATGTIEWATNNDVTDGGGNPWNRSTGWMPSRGDRVEVFVSDGVSEWKQFHGVVDKTTGSIGGGFQSTIIDDYDKLSASFSHQAMLRVMPPLAIDGTEPYRDSGLHPLYYVDRALRAGGFYCTPSREYDALVYAPMQGSWWAHYGLLSTTTGVTLNTATPWGLGRKNGGASYLPAKKPSMGTTVQMSALIAPDHAGTADFYLDYGGSATQIRLNVNAARVAIAQVSGEEVCRLPMGDGVVISLLAKSGTISLRTDAGGAASGTFTSTAGNLSLVRVNASELASIAGFQASLPATSTHEHASTRWRPSAILDTSSLYLSGVMDAAPNIESTSSGQLLEQISQATLSAVWIDELGVMRWAPSDALRKRPSLKTVTTLNDVLSLDWEDGLLGTASKVTVKGRKPAVTKGRWRNLVLARGGGDSLKSGDELSIFLEPASDEDWIGIHTTFTEVGGSANIWGPYNNPSFSAVGLYYTADGGTTTVGGLSCKITTELVGQQKVLVKYVAGNWPSDVEGVVATSPTNENLWPKNRNKDLPRLVGSGKIQWTDQEVIATGAGGPGPELVHDVGVWANRTDSQEMLERYASYIQSQTATPKPLVTGLAVVPDPRIQLGTVITVDSPGLMGVTLTALIVGVSNSFDSSFTQELAVRVIHAQTRFSTYAEFNANGGALTYQQWQAVGPSQETYEEFNSATG